MLTVKNPFATPSPTPSPVPKKSPLQEAEDIEAGKRLLQGRTESALTKLMGDIDTQKQIVEQAREQFTESLGDGVETTAAADAVHRAEEKLRDLEAALPRVTKKHEEALDDRNRAQQQVAIETEIEVVQHAKQVSIKFDQRLLDLEHLIADELAPALNAMRDVLIRGGIREGELHFQSEIPGLIKQLVGLVFCPILKQGYLPPNMRKYSCFSDVIPESDWVRSRPRPGQTMVRPIPNWQRSEN